MCNIYSQRKPREELRGLFNISHNRAVDVEAQASIFPGYMAPVVRRAEDGDLELVKLSWGFVLLRDGYAPKRVTNVRDDQILRSKFWRGSFEERRCLVPATSFCEPNGDVKPATWHWSALKRGRRAAGFRVPRHLAPLQGTDQEKRRDGGARCLCFPDHHAQLPGGHDQP